MTDLSNTELWAIGNEAVAGTLFTNATDALNNPDSAKRSQGPQDKRTFRRKPPTERLCGRRSAQGRNREGRQAPKTP